jgi:hypothetical protein
VCDRRLLQPLVLLPPALALQLEHTALAAAVALVLLLPALLLLLLLLPPLAQLQQLLAGPLAGQRLHALQAPPTFGVQATAAAVVGQC